MVGVAAWRIATEVSSLTLRVSYVGGINWWPRRGVGARAPGGLDREDCAARERRGDGVQGAVEALEALEGEPQRHGCRLPKR